MQYNCSVQQFDIQIESILYYQAGGYGFCGVDHGTSLDRVHACLFLLAGVSYTVIKNRNLLFNSSNQKAMLIPLQLSSNMGHYIAAVFIASLYSIYIGWKLHDV